MQIHIAARAIPLAVALAAGIGLAAGGGSEAVPDTTPATTALALTTTGDQPGEDDDDIATQAAAVAPKEGDVRGHRRILIVTYHVTADCTVHTNYPVNPGDRGWTIKKGATIAWRFNVTDTVAAISDPARGSGFPHWGFVTNSSCIGTSTGQHSSYQIFHNHRWVTVKTSFPADQPMPKRLLSGRSQYQPFWRAVDWHPSHGAVPGAERTLGHNRTLRDAPHRFVIGNVFADWHVRPTTTHQDGYTLVYVPALHRWGWLQL